MNGHPRKTSIRRSKEVVESVVPHESWWRRVLGRCGTRRLEPLRRADQRLARRVEDIIVGLGLTQTTFSASGGDTLHVPQVVLVSAGPLLTRLDVRILHGQTLNDFVVHAPVIANELGFAEVRMVPLDSSLIRFELLPDQSGAGSQVFHPSRQPRQLGRHGQ